MKTKMVNGAQVTEIPVDPSKTNDQLEREAARAAKRPAPSDAHKYSVSKIKTFQGMEGSGLNAVLLRDGKKAADLLDEGCGGMMYFDWVDHNKGVEEGKFLAFIEAERARIPADKESSEGFNDRDLFDGDIWVWEQVDKVLHDRRFARICKTNTVFQVGADIGGDKFRQVKGVTPDVRAWIEKKYPGQKIKFLNDDYNAAPAKPNLTGKHAFTAVVVSTGFILGRADFGTKGYTPIPTDRTFKTWDEAKAFADDLNQKSGVSKDEALQIVFNTMR